MNGRDDDYEYDPTYEQWLESLEDDEMIPDTIECPFCGHDLEERGGAYRCDNCEVEWERLEEVEIDRNEGNLDDYDEPSDADLFDRGMSVGTAGWAWARR